MDRRKASPRRLVLFIVFFVLPSIPLYLYRNRIYLWDVIARVDVEGMRVPSSLRSDAPGARVYINASNDIYLERGGVAPARLLLQHGMQAPAEPGNEVRCWLRSFCLASADAVPLPAAKYDGQPSMSARTVQWKDESGRTWVVKLF
jgi:hypothetical protein